MAIDPLTIAAGVNVGSSLLGSLFGGDSPAEKAQKLLLKFAKSGLPPELKARIIQSAMASINQGVQRGQQGTAARLSAGGIDPTSGLAETQLGKISRAGLQQRGNVRANIDLNEFDQQQNALRSVLGGGDLGGFNFLETLAGTSGNLLPVFAANKSSGGR